MAPLDPKDLDPEDVAEIHRYLPNDVSTKCRACLKCRVIMTKDQFIEFGCPNCRDVLQMQGSDGRVLACTTAIYQGFMSLVRPGAFASRFVGMDKRRPGCYALVVTGKIPEHILNESDMEGASDIEGRGSGRRSLSRKDSASDAGSASEAEGPPARSTPTRLPSPNKGVPTSPALPVPPSPPTPQSQAGSDIFDDAELTGAPSPKRQRLDVEGSASGNRVILEPEGDAEFNP